MRTTFHENLQPYEIRYMEKIVTAVKRVIEPEKIILFGSYARGNFVRGDVTVEEGVTKYFESDIDILVITRTEAESTNPAILGKMERLIGEIRMRTSVDLIVDPLAHVNEGLQLGRSFYVDILKDGVLLYERNAVPLLKPKILTSSEKKKLVLEYLENWGGKAEESHYFYQVAMRRAKSIGRTEDQSRISLNEAAFFLHQATERAYIAIWLALTLYQPKLHDLVRLSAPVERADKKYAVFPRETEEDKRLFKLLCAAYVDARYKKGYRITPEELKVLALRVRKLLKRVEELQTEWAGK